MSIPTRIVSQCPDICDRAIVAGYVGSLSHGTYTPKEDPTGLDDKDVMFVCVPPINYYFGLKEFGSRGTITAWAGDYDITAYEARKFISLLEKGNPNVLCLLWLPKNCYLKRTSAFETLLSHRDLFVGRHVYKSFAGYAYGQLHRMTHRRFEGYMGEKRKALVNKFGYDCKNAAHLIRLLRMAVEFLSTGELNVLRNDSSQLLEIKRGEWKLVQVQKEAEKLFHLTGEAFVQSRLPDRPDKDRVDSLCVSIVREAIGQAWGRAEVTL